MDIHVYVNQFRTCGGKRIIGPVEVEITTRCTERYDRLKLCELEKTVGKVIEAGLNEAILEEPHYE